MTGKNNKKATSSDLRKEVAAAESARELHDWVLAKTAPYPTRRTYAGVDVPAEAKVCWEAVASFGKHFDKELIEAVCDHPYAVARLARNSRLGEEGDAWLIQNCLDALKSSQRPAMGVKEIWPIEVFTDLLERGRFSLHSDKGEELWTLLEEQDNPYGIGNSIARLFLGDPSLSSERVEKIVGGDKVRVFEETLNEACVHPSATIVVWRKLFAREWSLSRFRPLLVNPRARNHPEVREVFVFFGRRSSARLLLEIAPDASPEEFAENFRAMMAMDPSLASQSLKEAQPEQLRRLEQRDILPLLSSEDATTRLTAITAAGHLGKAAPTAVAHFAQQSGGRSLA